MKETSNKIVGIIIVTRGAKDYLKSCLDSIKKQTHHALEIIVIDNSVNQNFSQGIGKYYPQIKLYSSPENLFYCAALNSGY